MIELLDIEGSIRHFRAADTDDLFTSADWISVVAQTYGIETRGIIDRADNATLPLAVVDDLAGRRLIGLPFVDYIRLPIELEAVIGLANHALEHFPDYSIMMRVAADLPNTKTLGEWKLDPSAVYHRLPVAAEEVLWRGLSQSFRNQVRQGWRHGVTASANASVAALDRFIALHTGLRNRKFSSIPQPRSFFVFIFDRFIAEGRGFFVEASYEDSVVASCLVIQHADILYYKFSASSPVAVQVRANNVMLWELLRKAAGTAECRAIDLGRAGLSDSYAGLRHFKDSLGASARPIVSMTHPAKRTDERAAKQAAEFLSIVKKTCNLIAASGGDLATNDTAAGLFYRYFA